MKFGILLAMGLVASTALIGAERAVNAFLAVDGGGIDDDGSIVVDRNSPDSVKVSARPGWFVNGRESVSVDPKRGSRLTVTSRLGEDEDHVHFSRIREKMSISKILDLAPRRFRQARSRCTRSRIHRPWFQSRRSTR
jgi:hypothetical protein